MAITIVGTSTTTAAVSTSAAFVLPAGVVDGDIILVGIYKEASGAVTNPSGEGYSDADPTQQAEANGTNFWAYWYKADLQTADASATHTFTFASVWRQGCAIILRGANAIASQFDTDPPAATIDTTTTSATCICPADTAATANDLAVWYGLTFDSLGSTFPATNDGNTVTERFDDTNNVHMGTATYTGTGTVSALSITKSASTGQDTSKTFLVKIASGAATLPPGLGPTEHMQPVMTMPIGW